ncbi:hypothetical protein PG991_010718 [Apiospora marii]|uniref:Uncharacterized protein n=1 Tax=Apiospora marii TaxID=335849 RepID=A0ABR1RC47_9PEZI
MTTTYRSYAYLNIVHGSSQQQQHKMSRTMTPAFELPPPTPPPTRPATPDSMSSNASSDQQEVSSPSSTEHQQQQQPQPQQPPALPPLSFSQFSPGPLFGPPPPHPAAPTTATDLPRTPPRTRASGQTVPQPALRPLDFYFGPHLNNDLKRRRAVHEYMLCRMTQDLTALYIQRALLALALLRPLPPPPSPSAPLTSASSSPETLLTALLVTELLTLLQRQATLRAAALRTVRTMWSLGLPSRTVARADAFVRGTPPPPPSSSSTSALRHAAPYRRSLAERFRAVYGASYRDYRRHSYYPHSFRRNGNHASWCYHLGLNEFEIGP